MNRMEQIGLVKKLNQVTLTSGYSLIEQTTLPEDLWNEVTRNLQLEDNFSYRETVIMIGTMRAACKAFYKLPLPKGFKRLRLREMELTCRGVYDYNNVAREKQKAERKRLEKINEVREDEWYYGKGWICAKKPQKLDLAPYRYT